MDNYGTRLKAFRKNKGLTQIQAASLMGIPQQTYQRYETGKLDLKMSTIHNICTSLQMSSDLLLGISVEPGSDSDGASGE